MLFLVCHRAKETDYLQVLQHSIEHYKLWFIIVRVVGSTLKEKCIENTMEMLLNYSALFKSNLVFEGIEDERKEEMND